MMRTSEAQETGASKPTAVPARRWRIAAALVVGLAAFQQGCTGGRPLSTFLFDRMNDTGDMVDVGLSFSKKPCFSAYACGLGLFTAGAAHFDGYFAGLGGGGLGVKRHYLHAVGLVLYSYEESAWGDFDLDDPTTVKHKQVGLLSRLLIPADQRGGGPS
jgi:hypothetical protein